MAARAGMGIRMKGIKDESWWLVPVSRAASTGRCNTL
jgi:hypothetical protein